MVDYVRKKAQWLLYRELVKKGFEEFQDIET